MANLTVEMKDLVNKGLVFVGTIDEKGMPNVSPKGSAKVSGDESISFMEGSGKKTFENLKKNPRVTAAVVNRETREGYQFKGVATVSTSGPAFEQAKKSGRSIVAMVNIKVEEIYSLKPGKDAGKRLA